MKYTALLISAVAGLALAAPQPQEESSAMSVLTSSAVSSTVVVSDASTTVSLSPQATCLEACELGDVNCQARCLGTAHPNEAQANQTTECVAQCDQGDGSPAATERYSQCVQSCIASYFPTTSTAGAVVGAGSTAASNMASATSGAGASASGAAATASSAASDAASSASKSAAAAASTGAAANNAQMGASAAGIAGLFMAIFAL